MSPMVLLLVLTTVSSMVSVSLSCDNKRAADDKLSSTVTGWFSYLLANRYGDDPAGNGPIPYDQLEPMMDDYGVGSGSEELVTVPVLSNYTSNIDYWECYSKESLLALYSDEERSPTVSDLCPMILQQIKCSSSDLDTSSQELLSADSPTALPPPQTEKRIATYEAWLYATLFIMLISLCSLAGVVVIPFMNKHIFKHILVLLVGLAVGSLVGSAIFQLIPACLDLDLEANPYYAWRSSSVIAGIFMFFNTERIMKLIIGRRNANALHSHSHGHSHSTRHDDIVEEAAALRRDPFESSETNTSVVDVLDGPIVYSQLTNGDSKHQMNGCEGEKGVGVFGRKKKIAPVAWMIIFGDGVHNFVDGLAIGAAFTTSKLAGVSMSLACICEELPHELGDFGILLNSGMSLKQAIGYNFLSACTAFIGMIFGILLGENTDASVWIFGFAGGMFLYISLVDMVPEMNHADDTDSKPSFLTFALQNLGLLMGYSIMLSLAMYGSHIAVW